ncbi:hypothetical protein FSP39_024836 [Pinctada imbricata]|uniref:SOCS box domain-containing protein n=1 Tax=Pinctada imbricata TaxID=66713 RepID=A0AA88Y4P7_PINIB|nr:hypothetical protein FSP39_024836 [Pinctada imbricata]
MGNCIGRRTTSTSIKKRSSTKCDDQFPSPPYNDNSDDNDDSDNDESEGLYEAPVIGQIGYAGYSEFHFAAWNGETEKVNTFLLDEHFDYDRQTRDRNTPFSLAAHGGELEVFEILLSRGANIHNHDHENDTPMHYAAMHKSFTMVEKLIDHGAEVNVQNDFGTTPLWYAAFHGDVSLLKLLLYHNADASMDVCATGAGLLIEYGASYDVPRSPLYVAVDKCAEDCVQALILAGCDLSKEKWLHEGDYPKRDDSDDEDEILITDQNESIQRSVTFLTKMASSPRSLLSICRTFLRQRLGKNLRVVVKDLEIPNSLADFLILADFNHDR